MILKSIFKKIVIIVVVFLICGFGSEFYLQTTRCQNFDQWIHPKLYSSDIFCEDRFPCRSIYQDFYNETVKNGYDRMRDSRVVICGLARDIADNIDRISSRIENMGNLFKDYNVLIFENDSMDGTRDLLYRWQDKNSKVHVIETDVKDCKYGLQPLYNYGPLSMNRIERMAFFRNKYLDIVKKDYQTYDYMFVVDMDMKGPWSMDGVANSIGHSEWDAIGSYGVVSFPGSMAMMYVMYDPLAYISLDEDIATRVDSKSLTMKFLKVNFIELADIHKGDPLIPVKSCFAGMAIYKIPSILNAQYAGGRCEHIELHRMMAENGHDKVYMNPSQIILCGHQGPKNLTKIFTHPVDNTITHDAHVIVSSITNDDKK